MTVTPGTIMQVAVTSTMMKTATGDRFIRLFCDDVCLLLRHEFHPYIATPKARENGLHVMVLLLADGEIVMGRSDVLYKELTIIKHFQKQ